MYIYIYIYIYIYMCVCVCVCVCVFVYKKTNLIVEPFFYRPFLLEILCISIAKSLTIHFMIHTIALHSSCITSEQVQILCPAFHEIPLVE